MACSVSFVSGTSAVSSTKETEAPSDSFSTRCRPSALPRTQLSASRGVIPSRGCSSQSMKAGFAAAVSQTTA